MSDLLPENEVIVNIFESVQKSITYFFVHTENAIEGKVYLFSPELSQLTLKISGLSLPYFAYSTPLNSRITLTLI